MHAEGGATILVVEDEPLVRLSIGHYLVQAGYSVRDAHNADEALQLVRRSAIDVLLTDLALPDFAGDCLAQRVHEIRPSMRLVLMSAYPLGWVRKPMALAPEEYLVLEKPFTRDELLHCIRQSLHR